MCGITGFWGEGSDKTLVRMRDALQHRGPDAYGTKLIGEVGLAHRRLSILDLTEAGNQPMSSIGDAISIVFNGEIYNYRELKAKFLGEYSFRGTSDTEVILNLYDKLGIDFLKYLRGMFAIALYDKQKNILILARDHLGKKPLYWTKQGGTFVFGSELKALREHPLFKNELDEDAIAQYLVYEYIPSPKTIYKGVYKLAPGTQLIFDGEKTSQDTFWSPSPAQGSYKGTIEEACLELDTLIEQAVVKRLVSDVPLGIFLSGGLDSSAITYYAQKNKVEKLRTFSVGFEESSFDERSYAAQVSDHIGTDHHELLVDKDDLIKLIDDIPEILDEPMADSSIIPTTILSRFARSEVAVSLGGDGADELLHGYGTFFAHKFNTLYRVLPRSLVGSLSTVADTLPVSHKYMSFDFRLKKLLSGIDQKEEYRNTYWLGAFQPEEVEMVMKRKINKEKILSFVSDIYAEHEYFPDGLQHEYLRGYLAEDILVKTDRASMSCGLEVRAPFLDLDVVNFALSLDVKFKYRGVYSKYLLKRTMKNKLPNEIINRPKKGFNIPLGSWIQHELKDVFRERLLEGQLVKSGLFDKEALAILLESHITGKADNRKKLWTLMVLALWMERWI